MQRFFIGCRVSWFLLGLMFLSVASAQTEQIRQSRFQVAHQSEQDSVNSTSRESFYPALPPPPAPRKAWPADAPDQNQHVYSGYDSLPTQRLSAVPAVPAQHTSSKPISKLPTLAPAKIDEPAKQQTIEVIESSSEDGFFSYLEPNNWFEPDWKGSFQLGINGSEGNARTLSLKTGGNLKRKTDYNLTQLDLTYAKTLSKSLETQHNAIVNLNTEWPIKDSYWSVFVKGGLEYDEFKAFDLRIMVNSGGVYHFLKEKNVKLKGRFGAGVSKEVDGPDDSYVPELLFGLEWEKKLTKRQKIYLKAEYFPDAEDFANYRIVTDGGWEVLLDEEANLSLKLGVKDRYDSTPNGTKPNDFDYSMLLLWKL